MEEALGKGFELLYDGKDAEALALFTPMLSGRSDGAHKRPQLLQLSYGAGLAHYHTNNLEQAISELQRFLQLRDELLAEVEDFTPPLAGVPLARFYLSHALFNSQRLPEAKVQLDLYLDHVAADGPQRVLNMPDGWGGKKITPAERAASRFRSRASSNEAQADAHTMLALLAERETGSEAALPHLLKCAELAGPERQQAEAHDNLARVYKTLGRDEDATVQRALAEQALEKHKAKEEEAARKKKEEAEPPEAPPPEALAGEADAGGEAGSEGAAAEEKSGKSE